MLTMSQDATLRDKLREVIQEHFEKIQFHAHCNRTRRTKRYVPERTSIEINGADLKYAYA
jgi:hypothetical protein